MTAEEYMALAMEVIANELAERVVKKLLERQKQALVVYTGSNINASVALRELRTLRDDGFTYRIFFTRSAARILDTKEICAALLPEEVWIDEPGDSPEALTRRYDTILVPTLTVNTAAHVAACMADTPGAAIILDGLMRGKNVIVSRDGCCPENPERVKRGFHMAPALKHRLSENLQTLQSYGARVCDANQLADRTQRVIREGLSSDMAGGPTPSATQQPPEAKKSPRPTPPSRSRGNVVEVPMEGKVLSRTHVQLCPNHATLLVPRGTLITQLAADQARQRDIQIQFKS